MFEYYDLGEIDLTHGFTICFLCEQAVLYVAHILCASAVRGKLKCVLLSWKSCGVLKYKFTINFSSSYWNHKDQSRSTMFIMLVLMLPTKNEAPVYRDQYTGRIKLSVLLLV